MINKIMWGLFLFGIVLWGYVGVLWVSEPSLPGVGVGYQGDKDSFDGSYSIPYSERKCGDLGYAFKLLHQRDGYSSLSNMNKSNCKANSSGRYEGYIYVKDRPSVRIFWVETEYGVTYQG